jgi:hypothetical protein
MYGLPRSTLVNKIIPKKAIFEKLQISTNFRKKFDQQVYQVTIIAEISPVTLNILSDIEIPIVYVIQLSLKTKSYEKRILESLSRMISQKMVFVCKFEETACLAIHIADRIITTEFKSIQDVSLEISGYSLSSIWDNISANIADVVVSSGKKIEDVILEKENHLKLISKIQRLEFKALTESQPRRKWEIAQNIRELKSQLGDNEDGS